MATMSSESRAVRTTPREAIAELLWFWAIAALVLTAALAVVGGLQYLASPGVQIVLGGLFLLTCGHLVAQHRRADELRRDPRLRHARERRGF